MFLVDPSFQLAAGVQWGKGGFDRLDSWIKEADVDGFNFASNSPFRK